MSIKNKDMDNNIYDTYAAAALQALIAAYPLVDGLQYQNISELEERQIIKQRCQMVHSYARAMMETRNESIQEYWKNQPQVERPTVPHSEPYRNTD